ncbi:type VII secretion-associated serine protease mycosin [Streptomyces gibsoniae]|uniref:Type VII secretion-associated serine protease mycosin n=1 Tax=Streptomyces gibsoniae TaxID=3075529 RepID=A0ABU2TXM8_9ACTN|nr:type VII secretion-associated serine protease mycosin [Streptomyces sp. DSM 41699]MDT0465725.1 type VII secretion-associated serine protease mycosin [Streptomyces sp. DSM 41699]
MNVFDADAVWAASQGEGVTVAVVDTGVDSSHPDLSGQVLKGKDFTGDGNAQEDLVGHGTRMASIIAAHGHGEGNKSGMMGLAPKAKILPLRVIRKRDDKNQDETWAAAVHYAVDQGAKVINLSFGDEYSQTGVTGREAIAYAEMHDVVVVAGTGNNGGDVGYPAALPGVVAVGAVDKEANLWENSNTGKQVALTAPGVDILAANKTRSQGYGIASGTSDSTAYVSAAAALVRAKYPDLTAGQVINRLIKSATFANHKGLKAPDEQYGYGIVRPYSALTMNIPAGPKGNPLGQLDASGSTSTDGSKGTGASAQAEKKSSSSGAALIVVGGVVAVVIIGAIAFVVMRNRRNGGNGGPGSGGGISPQGSGYPNAQQPYPNAAPNQGYPAAPGQFPQQPNPYTQQPPRQGQ